MRVYGGWGWYSPWWWGYGYYPYPYGYPYYRGDSANPSQWTAVKTDVEPDESALYLDGKLIGTADDFDGYPDRLYLGRGHYKLEFRLDGYQTYTTELDAAPGRAFRIDQHLKKIPGAKHYGSYEPARPEGGVVRYFRKRGGGSEPESPDTYDSPRREEYRGDQGDQEETQEDMDENGPEVSDSRLSFDVEPEEAAVYIDGRFAGGARELNSISDGFVVGPGEHHVTVTCPGYQEKTVDVMAPVQRSARVRVRLTK